MWHPFNFKIKEKRQRVSDDIENIKLKITEDRTDIDKSEENYLSITIVNKEMGKGLMKEIPKDMDYLTKEILGNKEDPKILFCIETINIVGNFSEESLAPAIVEALKYLTKSLNNEDWVASALLVGTIKDGENEVISEEDEEDYDKDGYVDEDEVVNIYKKIGFKKFHDDDIVFDELYVVGGNTLNKDLEINHVMAEEIINQNKGIVKVKPYRFEPRSIEPFSFHLRGRKRF